MNRTVQLVLTLFAVAVISAVAYGIRTADSGTASQQTASPSPQSTLPPTSVPASVGAEGSQPAVMLYTTEAEAQQLAHDGRDVVYFFTAAWSAECQKMNLALDTPAELAKLGASTTIIRVDYDTYTSLAQKYGVTAQATFVRIDPDGERIKRATLSDFSQLLTF